MGYYDHDTLNQAVQLEHHNALARNSDEVRLIYPEPLPADSSWKIIEECEHIGAGSGGFLLAAGDWRIAQDMVLHNPAYAYGYGMGPHTRLLLDPGVRGFVLESTAARHSRYAFGDMMIQNGLAAFHTVDTTGDDTGRQIQESTWEGLTLLGQSDAALKINSAIYCSAFRDIWIEGLTTRPAYGLDVDAYGGFHNILFSRCSFKNTDTAALNCAGTQPENIHDLTLVGCRFESNQGQIANLENCDIVTFLGGWWENNCARVEAMPQWLIDFGNGEGLVVDNPHVWPTGAGNRDPADNNRAWIIKANNGNSHAFRGNARGYLQYGDAAHKVYADGWVDMDCRQRMVKGPDGQWYTITPGQVVNLEPVT